jgi:hypothetical protein
MAQGKWCNEMTVFFSRPGIFFWKPAPDGGGKEIFK